MWCMQTAQKLGKVAEVLRHMLRGGATGDEGSGGAALRNTLGVVSELSKEVEAFRKEQYAAWEVGTTGAAGPASGSYTSA